MQANIDALSSELMMNSKEGNYEISNNKLEEVNYLKDRIVEIDKEIDAIQKPDVPKSKVGSNISKPAKKSWTAAGYKISNFE
jgi:hypothetical protein